MPKRRILAPAFLLLGLALAAQTALIKDLKPSDPLFRQLCADVEDARRLLARPEGAPRAAESLVIYEYRVKKEDRLLALAARCTVPIEAIATLNRIAPGSDLKAGDLVYIPAMPGLFLPALPASDLEQLMTRARESDQGAEPVTLRRGSAREHFLFYPGAEFSPSERAFFLNFAFRFPLPAGTLTSPFGWRRNPVTGKMGLHAGLDLAAPYGTPVYAAGSGSVVEISANEVYGNYVVVQHEGGWRSLYGHLSEIDVDLRKSVRSGSILGKVGSTGQSTGPHLHFELRRNGEAKDPAGLISRGANR